MHCEFQDVMQALVLVKISISGIKHYNHNQVGKKRVYLAFSSELSSTTGGSQDRN